MDELKFRREAYENPNNHDDDFLSAMRSSDERQAFVKDLKRLDSQIESALKVDVPEGLEAKLLLNQQLHQHQVQRRKTGFTMALVASVAFVAGISFTLLRLGPVDLGQHALAHVYHEDMALISHDDVSFNTINTQLASLGTLANARFTEQPGQVLYSTYCDFQGVKSIHLVMQGAQGKVTLFIVPVEDRMILDEAFADNRYQGMGFAADNAYMLLVGEHHDDLNNIKEEIKQSFI
ncbi:hypothetical protein TUM4644_22330 [Shewanella colwelliana]|uniref:DUF3379 domain-containing protein n=1 Tax=Shewanella colwelliana TaxID=23 RepID=A0A1E5IZS9_SHECO|nr:DUF3379 domain-containing protein [Shewanella colwelliana]MDX1282163.1 DUF3379 domain-containing protein [Shewanella colwelliana]OEG75293.1 hypothetical protein BEL05_08770 [Shewanella colwelliana]GIU26342.1 hypothetical protein TUM4644_22330 [Shewanella colwelliana]GIU36426.1 hypothetical protein TUM3794_05580 [Shewanella colwelliana]